MKALLIGGTGTISTEVSRRLLQDGWELYLLNRGKRALHVEGAHLLQGDVRDAAAMQALLAGRTFDMVADFIAFTPQDVQRDMDLFTHKTGQYVFISSASAYQKPPTGHLITESTPLANPHWQYSRDKIACEELLMRHFREHAFPATIVRPSHTYCAPGVPVALHGQMGGGWPVLRRMMDGEPVVVHGDGTSLWTLTHARDFAKGFAGLAGNPHAIGHAVHITGDEVLSWNQIYAILGGILGVQPRLVHAPSGLLAKAGKPFGYDFTGTLLGDKANCLVFDNTKIKRLAPGFAATTRFDEGARESIRMLLENPALQVPDPAFDRFCDRVAAVMEQAALAFDAPLE